jgi:hypothetical protein
MILALVISFSSPLIGVACFKPIEDLLEGEALGLLGLLWPPPFRALALSMFESSQ